MGDAYGWVAAAGLWTSVFLFVVAAIKFMTNNPEEARRFLAAGLAALFIAAAGPATSSWLVGGVQVQAVARQQATRRARPGSAGCKATLSAWPPS